MRSQICRSISRAERSLLSTPKASSRSYSESFGRVVSHNASRGWISRALAIPAAAYMLVDRKVHAAELERTFIAIKPNGVQRGLA
ncbi:hypothetical protein ACFX13_031067 [Malus domestica]